MIRIVTNPKILAGKPTIEGTRISVSLILNLLAHGQTIKDILEDYPHLTHEGIKAAIEFAEKKMDRIRREGKVVILHEISGR
jgi:uncharacterized protein (DUF433 family)